MAHAALVILGRIGGILKPGRIAARRRCVVHGRRGLAQRLMWSLLIELVAELIEAVLLRCAVGLRRIGAFGLERLVHPFMPPVLLGPARLDPLRHDAELQPPYRQPTQSRHPTRGERRSVVRADRARQAVLSKHPLQLAAAVVVASFIDCLDAQQIAAVGVGHGQRIAARAVLGMERAFEIGAPDVVGPKRRAQRQRRWSRAAPAACAAD